MVSSTSGFSLYGPRSRRCKEPRARAREASFPPSLVIAAERDEVIPRASTERLLARFRPGVATLRVVAGDHNSVSEQPEYGPILGGSPGSERR